MKATAEPEVSTSLAGQTLRWTFEDGPTAGKTFEHSFSTDGTVAWREVGGEKDKDKSKQDAKPPKAKYAAFEIAPDVHLVSYLSEAGFTLSVALNFKTEQCYGVASNNESWFPLTGTFEVVE